MSVDPVEARVLHLTTELPEHLSDAKREIDAAASEFADKIRAISKRHKGDVGQTIAAVDRVCEARNATIKALQLPLVNAQQLERMGMMLKK